MGTKNTTLGAVLALQLALSCADASAQAVEYKLTVTLPGVTAWAINASGQIAGWNQLENTQVYTPGQGATTLAKPDGVSSMIGYHLNDAGQVGGLLYYSSSYWGQTYNSFVYTPGAADPYKLANGAAPGIDYQLDASGNFHKLTSGTPSWAVSNTIATDSAGQYVAGYSYFNDRNSYGAAWRQNPDGSFTNIGQSFVNAESQSYGVNASGTTVGRVAPTDGGGLWAFVYADGQAYNLYDVTEDASRAGWTRFLSAQDVNSSGQITGWGIYSDSSYSGIAGFVLTPVVAAVPEPASFGMLGAGLLALCIWCRLKGGALRSC